MTFLIRFDLSSCITLWKVDLREEQGPLVKSAGGIQVKVHFTVTSSETEFPILSRWEYLSQSLSFRCVSDQDDQARMLMVRIGNLSYEDMESFGG